MVNYRMERAELVWRLLSGSERTIKIKLYNYVYMFAIEEESAVDAEIFWNRLESVTEGLRGEFIEERQYDRHYRNEVEKGIREMRERVEELIRDRRNVPRRLFAWVDHMSNTIAMDMWSTLQDVGYWYDAIHECDPEMNLDPPYF